MKFDSDIYKIAPTSADSLGSYNISGALTDGILSTQFSFRVIVVQKLDKDVNKKTNFRTLRLKIRCPAHQINFLKSKLPGNLHIILDFGFDFHEIDHFDYHSSYGNF